MKILVAIKRVVDPGVRIHVRPDGGGVDLANVKMAMNPFDEIAVEEAVRLKEKGLAREIVAVSVGPAKSLDILRTALAMGADRGLHVPAEGRVEPLAVAKLLAAVARIEQPDFALLGKQAIDDDSNQTGQMLAALLGWPQGTFISALEPEKGRVVVTREVDGGLQRLELSLPAVLTTDLRLNVPRHLSLPSIMKAKRLPVEELTPAALGVDIEPRQSVLRVEAPPQRKPGIRVASVEELASLLRREAGIL